MYELDAVWLNGFMINGSTRVPVGTKVAIEDGLLVDADYATHKIIGLWSPNICGGNAVALVTDVITNEPSEFIINY